MPACHWTGVAEAVLKVRNSVLPSLPTATVRLKESTDSVALIGAIRQDTFGEDSEVDSSFEPFNVTNRRRDQTVQYPIRQLHAAFADLQLICITLDTNLLQIKAFTNIGLFVYPETHFCQRMIHRQRNSTIRLGNPCLFCGIEIICLLASGKVELLGLI